MAIIDRVKAILMSPRAEWQVIDGESGDIAGIYRHYLIYLAAIPALASFLGLWLFGFSVGGITVKVGFFSGLINAVLYYLLSLVLMYVIALIVDVLAPTFYGTRNQLAAFKLVAYGSTAALVAGVFYLIPAISFLAWVGALFSIYLIWVGLPVLMKSPPGKNLPYMLLILVCSVLASWLLSVITRPATDLVPTSADVTLSTPAGEVRIDAAKTEEAGRKLEAATRQIAEAAKSGDPAAAAKAATDAVAAVSAATGGRAPITVDALKALIPESLAGLKRDTYEVKSGEAMGVSSARARADYRDGERSLALEINDLGGLAALASLANWANVTGEKETQTMTEKISKVGGRTVRERIEKDGSETGYSLILTNGVIVEARGRGFDINALKAAVDSLDLAGLEATRKD